MTGHTRITLLVIGSLLAIFLMAVISYVPQP